MRRLKSMFPVILVSLGLVMAGLLPVQPAVAGKGDKQYRQSAGGLDAAVARVQRQTGGRVLRAQQQGSVYVIKVLMPSGVVKTFRVAAD